MKKPLPVIVGTLMIVFFLPLLMNFLGFDAWSAEEGAGEGGEALWSKFFWRIINFTILVAVLYKLLAKPTKDFFGRRRESIKEALEEAKKAKEEAEEKYRELSTKLALLDKKVEEITKELREEGEMERDRIINEALKNAKNMIEQAEATSKQEVKKAITILRKEAASLVINLAEETLKREIKKEDQERLVKEYIEGLSSYRGLSTDN